MICIRVAVCVYVFVCVCVCVQARELQTLLNEQLEQSRALQVNTQTHIHTHTHTLQARTWHASTFRSELFMSFYSQRVCVCVCVYMCVSIGLTEHTDKRLARVGLTTQDGGRKAGSHVCVCMCVCVQGQNEVLYQDLEGLRSALHDADTHVRHLKVWPTIFVCIHDLPLKMCLSLPFNL